MRRGKQLGRKVPKRKQRVQRLWGGMSRVDLSKSGMEVRMWQSRVKEGSGGRTRRGGLGPDCEEPSGPPWGARVLFHL